jgi:hypothetical protein
MEKENSLSNLNKFAGCLIWSSIHRSINLNGQNNRNQLINILYDFLSFFVKAFYYQILKLKYLQQQKMRNGSCR